MKLLGKLLKLIFLFLVACALIAIGYYFAVTKDATLQPNKLVLTEKSLCIYNRDDMPVKNIASVLPKQTVGFSEIPNHTKLAFISVEDKRFYSHNGFDVKRILSASLKNIKAHSYKQGASTISQQLIKNTHLSNEKTLKRKLQEWKLTRQLERRYTKEEILEKYLNSIYFGHSCFGITSAADFYFGKTPQELSIADSAILAALVKAPNNYSPFKKPENCQKRKLCVLNCMFQNNAITEKEKQEALAEPLPKQRNNTTLKDYFHFLFDELSNIAEQKNFTIGGKVEIYSHLDETLQTELQTLANTYQESDKSILVLDNNTHGYKACISTVGNIQRLPGSLIKPLLVYTPAMEESLITPATPVLDEKINYNGYTPENYNGEYHGYTSVRECVEKSLNIPAVKILSSLTVKKGVEYLRKLSLPVEENDYSLALALGGMKNGYTLKQLIDAYSVYANEGSFIQGNFIKKILINGTCVYQQNNKEKQVFSKENSYLMTDILKSTAKNGTAKKLRNLPFDIAAKTGTVGTKKGNTDAYAISLTKNDLVGVWIGNQNNDYIQSTGGGIPCNLLLRINEYLYNEYQKKNQSIPAFQQPKNVMLVALDKSAYYDTHTLLLADKQSPIEYQFNELFHVETIPKQASIAFSTPTIQPPKISFKGGIITLKLPENAPRFYEYKIEKYNYATHNTYAKHSTLYFGKYLESIQDDDIQPNTEYVYTVTPIYNSNTGKTVTLPKISTKRKEINNDTFSSEKNWWEY